ncbi:MAG: hypothetical protein A2Y03_05865 [Omnitrophica WOR_2 bacterium GWF2_38_59]|nr:MAG: hypothetical protein A2Y03_05865 [Omnitrophica WOR_2 bacterium GWF2_38_59]OGX49181.1 MAG: hypothetical protein A2243_07740 [Omnitrophica WOR_2 bacterium RIFOXYA2_FULL_38_17]OGX52657.1 MAG: hypothetical protein A2267_10830 [Omnitrophica WOR_2 bacterium RIFOXYA12_FULL_38_10]OGX56467.1 MAG: hypothetical protein A2306_11630 [Omnitrophica WOR_2 bacterium RIFOXYB2_FULL_38_16]OGX59744.1 MAG: hypothetical protein A2447_03025 [Omnitrophica WOR_2 bacterium RIFOXYC2_FULL_38_12]
MPINVQTSGERKDTIFFRMFFIKLSIILTYRTIKGKTYAAFLKFFNARVIFDINVPVAGIQ